MQKIEQVSGPGIPLLLDDIDTDRIIPARFLRCVTFDGIGDHAFEDDRQQDPNHPFNHERFRQAKVLVSGRNFGCGSSREHAPQSLMRWGLGAIIAESFAEIFFGNCTSLGIAAVTCARADLERLSQAIEQDPTLPIRVDLVNRTVHFGEQTVSCKIAESAREALITGQWDFLGQLLENESQIRERASAIPYLKSFA